MRTRLTVSGLSREPDGSLRIMLKAEGGTRLFGPGLLGWVVPMELERLAFTAPMTPPVPHPQVGTPFVLREETADEEEREKIIGEALSRARLALTALDLCENESGNGRFAVEHLEEGRNILAALCKYLVERDAVDPLERT